MRRKKTTTVILYILGVAMLIYAMFPIYWMTVSSLRGTKDFFSEATKIIPSSFSLDFFKNLLRQTNYPQYYKNSFVVAIMTTVVTIIAGTMMAYVLTRFRFRGSKALMNMMLIGYMLPPMLIAMPMLGLFIPIGLDDTLFGLVLAHTALTLPFGVWMLDGFFRTIPYELEESAMIDGATRPTVLTKIIFPLVTPGVAAVAIFSFITSWVDYTFGLMIVSSDMNKTVPLGLASMKGAYDLQWGEMLAGATLIALPMIIIFAFLTKYFIRGLTAGAVKG